MIISKANMNVTVIRDILAIRPDGGGIVEVSEGTGGVCADVSFRHGGVEYCRVSLSTTMGVTYIPKEHLQFPDPENEEVPADRKGTIPRTVSPAHFCGMIEANMDNRRISDADFRNLVRGGLVIVDFPSERR